MNEWNATTMRMAKPRKLASAKLDLGMSLRTAGASLQWAKRTARWRIARQRRHLRHVNNCYYRGIRQPYNAHIAPRDGGETATETRFEDSAGPGARPLTKATQR